MAGSTWRLGTWRMQNFKSVENAEVSLSPLTILLGPNSAGKSSLIQSILLFVQAQSSYERSDFLSLNGPLVRLGTYAEVRRKGGTGDIRLGGTLVQYPRMRLGRGGPEIAELKRILAVDRTSITWETRLGSGPRETPGRMRVRRASLSAEIRYRHLLGVSHRQPRDLDASIAMTWKARPDSVVGIPILGREFVGYGSPLAARDEAERLGEYTGVVRVEQVGTPETRVPVGGGMPIAGLPNVAYGRGALADAFMRWIELERYAPGSAASVGTGAARSNLAAAAEAAIRSFEDWRPTFQEALRVAEEDGSADAYRQSYEVHRQQRALEEIASGVASSDLPEFAKMFLAAVTTSGIDLDVFFDVFSGGPLSWARDHVTQYLVTGVQYLGPVRTAPRTVSLDAQYSRGVGVEGEITAAVLHGHRKATVQFVGPTSPELRTATLGEAVDEWMQALGLVDSVTTKDLGRYGIEVTVRSKGVDADLNLRNVGVGVSQVLPLVVLCLRSRPGSLILLEQPELHLHPAAQQRIADFLLAMSRSGRQLIVETHSDHMVTRLRRRIVEDDTDRLQNQVGFVYVTRSEDTGETEYQEVAANEYGGFADWPHGFFEQGQEEAAALIRAAVSKKAARDTSAPKD